MNTVRLRRRGEYPKRNPQEPAGRQAVDAKSFQWDRASVAFGAALHGADVGGNANGSANGFLGHHAHGLFRKA